MSSSYKTFKQERTVLEIIDAMAKPERGYYIRGWIETEFTLPVELRRLCDACFLRIMRRDQFMTAVRNTTAIQFGERYYNLHCASRWPILETSELIGVSFRIYEGMAFAVAQHWTVKETDRANPDSVQTVSQKALDS